MTTDASRANTFSSSLRGVPQPPGSPRTRLLRPEDLTAQQAALHSAIVNGPRASQPAVPLTDADGRLLGPFALMLLAPAVGRAVQQVGAALRADTGLSPRSRELAILAVAAHRRSHFEWQAHERAARDTGLDSAQLQQLLDGDLPDDLGDEDACVVRTARELLTRGSLEDPDHAVALRILGETRLVELVWLIGYYNMLAVALATLRPASA